MHARQLLKRWLAALVTIKLHIPSDGTARLLSYLLELGYTSSHLRIESSHCRNAAGLTIADVKDDVGTLLDGTRKGRHGLKISTQTSP